MIAKYAVGQTSQGAGQRAGHGCGVGEHERDCERYLPPQTLRWQHKIAKTMHRTRLKEKATNGLFQTH